MRLATITAATVLAMAALTGPATAQPAPPEVSVERAGEVFLVAYDLPSDAPAWAFFNSSLIMETRQPWRLQQWRVTTPGVVLRRVGAYDVLTTGDGSPVPRHVELEMRPVHHNLEADYATLTFTDGSIAMPTGIFDVFPAASLEAVEAVPADLNTVGFDLVEAIVRWRDRAGPVLFQGERYDGVSSHGANTYILFGQAEIVASDRLMTVVDPQLPAWIAAGFQEFGPRVADYYADRLGPGAFGRPTIMASWNGPTPNLFSMGGSVMPGLIVMNFEGEGVVEESPQIRASSRWFIAHESAHFWLGQTVRYAVARDAWITEGGADLMAVRAADALEPDYDARAELQSLVDECAGLAIQPVAEAAGRGEHRAFYACGAVFALAAEASQRRDDGGDWFDFLRPLIEANREDQTLTRAEWLAHLTAVSGDASLASDIELILDSGDPDPWAAIASLFARAGVAYTLDEEGRVVLD